MPFLSACEVMIHEEALYQMYVPLPLCALLSDILGFYCLGTPFL